MKYLKLYAVAAVAVVALFVVGGACTAEANTVLCTQAANPCPAGEVHGVGTEIKASLSETSKLTTTFKNIECTKSSVTAKVTSTGKAVGATVEGLTFEGCNCEVKVLGKGTVELEQIASTANATIKSNGTEITTKCSTIFGEVHCIYKTENTDLGTLTGGNPAITDTVSVNLPRLSTNPLCSEQANWDVKYEVTSPKPLFIEPNEAIDETVLCTEAAKPCPVAKTDGVGTEIKASLVSGTKSKLTTPYNHIECTKSSLTAKVTSTGKTISSTVEALSFEECNCEVKVLGKGTLELEHIPTTDATTKSTGTEVTTKCTTVTGDVHCIYRTSATDLGTLEGGNPAKVKVSGAEIPRLATDSRCDESGIGTKWDAEYEVTSPKPLFIELEGAPQTVLCTEATNPCPGGKADGVGTEIKASLSGTSKLTTTFKNIECTKSSITAIATSTSEKIRASVEGLTFEGCNCEVKVLQKGTLRLEQIAATTNATIKSSGTEITTECSTIFGFVHCIYVTESTDLGTLTGGNPAFTDTEGVNLPRLSTNGLCAEQANWDVKYEITSPKPLYVEPE